MIKHSKFRPLNPLYDQLVINNFKNAKRCLKFLRDKVYPYTYCYVYDHGRHLVFAVGKQDFMHMCGIKYKVKSQFKSSRRFRHDLLHNNVNLKRVLVHADGTTASKFAVISAMPYIFQSLNLLISDHEEIKYTVDADGQISTKKAIIGIGLREIHKQFYVPLTVLNLHKENKFHGYEVHAIIKKRRGSNQTKLVNYDHKIKLIKPYIKYFNR